MEKIYTGLCKKGLLVYQIVVLLFLFMKANPLVNSLIVTDLLMGVIVVFGAAIFAVLFWQQRKTIFTKKYFLPLYLFVASYVVTVVLNYKYAFMSNAKDIVWFVIQVATLYISSFYISEEVRERNFKVLTNVYIAVSGFFALFSLPFVFLAIGGVEEYGKWGFLSQRLFGLYRSPNYGAIYCVISIFLSLGLVFKKDQSTKRKVLYIINIIANLLYVIYSGSTTGKVILLGGVLVWCFLEFLTLKDIKTRLTKVAIYVCALCLLAVAFPAIKSVTSNVIKFTRIESEFGSGDTDGDGVSDDEEEIDFERTDYVEGSELGNGRLLHWEQAMKVYPSYALFGTSMRGYMSAVGNVLPETVGVQKAYSIENDFISLLVCTGTIGFIIFMAFMVIVLLRVKDGIVAIARDKNVELMNQIRTPLVIVVIIAASALFTDAIVFTNVIQSAVFWLGLGYFLNIKWMENK